jgi:hypothetical protein
MSEIKTIRTFFEVALTSLEQEIQSEEKTESELRIPPFRRAKAQYECWNILKVSISGRLLDLPISQEGMYSWGLLLWDTTHTIREEIVSYNASGAGYVIDRGKLYSWLANLITIFSQALPR